MKEDNRNSYYAASPEDWRKWLEKNHDKEQAVWLVMYRKGSGTPSITHDEAIDEALCYGWIDSKRNGKDDVSFYQMFSPRKPKSNWSRVNKEKVAKLIREKRMRPAGRALIESAKKNGQWDALNDVEDLLVPADLLAALQAVPGALENFEAFPRSSKRIILEWVMTAKQPATRSRRIEETARLAAENIRANHYRQPKGR